MWEMRGVVQIMAYVCYAESMEQWEVGPSIASTVPHYERHLRTQLPY
jgi:hypothetical protein